MCQAVEISSQGCTTQLPQYDVSAQVSWHDDALHMPSSSSSFCAVAAQLLLRSFFLPALLPHRVCCHWLSAMPAQHVKAPGQAQEDTHFYARLVEVRFSISADKHIRTTSCTSRNPISKMNSHCERIDTVHVKQLGQCKLIHLTCVSQVALNQPMPSKRASLLMIYKSVSRSFTNTQGC